MTFLFYHISNEFIDQFWQILGWGWFPRMRGGRLQIIFGSMQRFEIWTQLPLLIRNISTYDDKEKAERITRLKNLLKA